MRTYKNYTDQQIIDFSAEVTSLSQLLKKLGLKAAGGNFINMKRNLQRLSICTEHWTGQAWSKGEQLKEYGDYTRIAHLKKHLIIKRGHNCERCGISSWNDEPLVMEIDHKNGDRTNNDEANLEILCPNCHSQTPTWRNRKRDHDTAS